MNWKRIYIILAFFFSTYCQAQQINIPAFTGEVFGKGGNITLPITINGCFALDNEFKLTISDENGSFANESLIGIHKSFFTSFLNGIIPSTIPAGNGYKIKVSSTNPVSSVESNSFSIGSADVVEVLKPVTSNSNTINDSTFGRCQISSNQTLVLQQTVPAGYLFSAEVKDGTGSIIASNLTATQVSFVMVPGNYYSVAMKLTNTATNNISAKSFLVLATSNNLSLQTSGASDICLPDIKAYTINITGNGGIKNNYPGTQYSIEWGDGVIDTYTHCDLLNKDGELIHEYKNTSCGRPPILDLNPVQYNAYRVNVRASHVYCPNSFTAITTYSKVWQKPIADFINPLFGCINKPITFTNTSQAGLSGYNNVVSCKDDASYEWYVDGVLILNAPKDLVYTFTTTGFHTVKLVAANEPCNDEVIKQICIEDPITPNFKLNGQDSVGGCAPLLVNTSNTTDLTTGYFCRTPRWRWEVLFRSTMTPATVGTHYIITPTDTAESPNIQFLLPGEYLVRLSVENSCGTNYKDLPVTITDIAGVSFDLATTKYCGLKAIDFATDSNHKPTYNSNKGSENYLWTITGGNFSFLDGTSNTSAYPKIKFDGFSTYTINLQFTNSCGTKNAGQQISFYAPVNTTVSSDTTLCNTTPNIRLTATSTGPVSGGVWSIVSGDGSFSDPSLSNPLYYFGNNDRNNSSVVLRYTANPESGSACSPATDDVTITLTPRNIFTSAANKTICTGTNVNYNPTSLSGSTYTWTSALLSGTVTGNKTSGNGNINDILVNPSLSIGAVVKYIITPTLNGCVGENFELLVTVIPKPDLLITPATDTICTGGTTNFTLSSSYSSAIYKWTSSLTSGDATGFSNQFNANANNKITDALVNNGSVNAIVTYTITSVASDTANCEGETKTVVVVIRPGATVANAGIDQLLCNASIATLNGNVPAVGSGIWKQVGGPISNIVNPTNANTTISGLVGDNVYKYLWTVTGVGQCPSTSDTVTIINRPAVTVANAGDSIVVCDFIAPGSVALQANSNASRPFETGKWTVLSQPNGGNGIFSDASSASSNFTFDALGRYSLIYAISNDAGCTPTKDTVIINVFEKPVAGVISGNTNVCVGNDVLVTLSPYTGKIKKWQYNVAPLNDNIWKDTLVTSPSINFLSVSDSFAVRVIIESLGATYGCTSTDTSNVLIINAAPGTIPGTTGLAETVCAGINAGIIQLTGNTGNIVRWEYSTNNGNTWLPINNTNSSITYNNLSVSTYFRAVVQSGNCGDITSSATLITVLQPVTQAIVGADQILCSTSTVLEGNAPAAMEKGVWSQLSGPSNVAFNNTSSPIVNISGLTSGAYSFVWTLSNARCTPTMDTINVVVRPAITKANAGDSTVVCDFVTSGSIKLNGNVDLTRTSETHQWSILSQPINGNGIFEDASKANTDFNFFAAGTYQLVYTITNDAGCAPSKDTLVLLAYSKPVAGPITADTAHCGVSDVVVNLTSYTGSIKKWQYNAAPISDNIWRDTLVTNASILFANASDTFAIRVIVESNGATLGCNLTDTSNVLVINITPGTRPGTTATNDSVCYNNNAGKVMLTGNVGKVIRWETSENNGTTWQVVNDTTASINYKNLIATTWYRAIVESGSCGTIASSITVITVMNNVSKAAAGADQLICGTLVQLQANVPTAMEAGSWQQISGPSAATLSSTTTPSITAYNLIGGSYQFVWTIANGVCAPSSDTVLVQVRPAITVANAGSDTVICNFSSNGVIQLNASSDATRNFEVKKWRIISQPANGKATISYTTNPTAIFTFKSIGEYQLEWSIANDAGCTPSKDTLVIAVFESPVAGVVTSIPDVCIGANVTVNMGSYTGAIKKWQYNIAPINDNIWIDTLITSPNIIFKNVRDTFSVRVIVESAGFNAGCYAADTSNIVMVNVLPATIAGTTGPSDTICGGSNLGTIKLSNYVGRIKRWQYSIDGGTNWLNINDTTSSITYKNLAVTTRYRAIVESGNCGEAISSETIITVFNSVTVAAAGADQTLCAVTSTRLNGNKPEAFETGIWSQINGAQATISDKNISNPFITNLTTGTYTFVYTITNNACPSNSDTVEIVVNSAIVNEIDTIAKNICSGQAVTIKNKAISGGNGQYQYQWQSSVDGINWLNINNEINQDLTVIPTGDILLRRLVNSLPCTSISDVVRINVQQAITNNVISKDQVICVGNPTQLLNGSIPTGATGTYTFEWQQSIDSGATWTNIINTNTQDYNPGNITINTMFRRNVTSGNCVGAQGNYSNVVSIIVNPNAKASFSFTKDVSCPPFVIDTTIITTNRFDVGNDSYNWYVNNKLIGTGAGFPGYTMVNSKDSVTIKLITLSKYGCSNDTMQHTFYTKLTATTPAFTASVTSGCGPLAVDFSNQTPNQNLYTFKWNFGNGSTSVLANPATVVFKTNPNYGDTIYKVALTIYSECDSITVYKDVLVKSPAQALFKPDRTVGCSPMKVTFNNFSEGADDFTWNFDDGTILNTKQTGFIEHTFTSAVQDTFRVQLIARSSCGSDTQYYSIVVSPNAIKLNLNINGDQRSGCTPHTVQFINNTKGATSFRWDFGDGNVLTTTKNIDTILHTYNNAGSYTVKLVASNGCSDTSTTETITIYNKPVVDFSLQPATACIGAPIYFTNLSDTTTGLSWNFGDGTTSNLTNPMHKYSVAGVYRVTLIGLRQYAAGNACLDSAIKTVTIISSLPGSFSVSDSVGRCTPFTVTFTNNNQPSKLTIWNFGDGTKDTGDVVKHTFVTTGTFKVTMTATDAGGCKYIYSQNIVVGGPQGSFTYNNQVKCDASPVRFDVNATGVDSIRWNFGDGTKQVTNSVNTVYHVYKKSGLYLPSIELLVGSSCNNLVKGIDTIKVDAIKAGFNQSLLANCGNSDVTFKDTSASFSGIKTSAWQFGDGKVGVGSTSVHNYTASGTWMVQLISTSNFGCSDTVLNPMPLVLKELPIASIFSDTAACANKRVNYTSAVVSRDTIMSYRWSFSNGVSNTGTTSNNVYTTSGKYMAMLVVSTINGCLDTAVQAININPVPFVKASPEQAICVGQSIQITAGGGTSYSWGPYGDLSCINCASPIVNPTKTTKYTVTALNGFGCAAQDTVLVKVSQPFKLQKLVNDTLCIGQTSQLFASGADVYSWSPTIGLSNALIANPVATPASTTRYRVIGADANNCFADTAYVTVAVGKRPTIDLGIDKVLSAGTQYALASTVTNGPITKWQWTPARDLSCSTCPQPIANIKKDITYTVAATNEYGCTATDTLAIKVFCQNTQVFIPNVFTPDGDGINDVLMVRGSGINSVKSFRIFNRWGEVVFDKANFAPNEKSNGWNGTIRGSKAPTDVYIYTCEVVCENGSSFVYKGNVAIIK